MHLARVILWKALILACFLLTHFFPYSKLNIVTVISASYLKTSLYVSETMSYLKSIFKNLQIRLQLQNYILKKNILSKGGFGSSKGIRGRHCVMFYGMGRDNNGLLITLLVLGPLYHDIVVSTTLRHFRKSITIILFLILM